MSELQPDEAARLREARDANLVTAKQPSERGPLRFTPFDFPTHCRVCRAELTADDTVFFVGRQVRGATYIRHAMCARRPLRDAREPLVATADQSGRVIRKPIEEES